MALKSLAVLMMMLLLLCLALVDGKSSRSCYDLALKLLLLAYYLYDCLTR